MKRKSAQETRMIHIAAKKELQTKLEQKKKIHNIYQNARQKLNPDDEPTLIIQLPLHQQILNLQTNPDKNLQKLAQQVKQLQEDYDQLTNSIKTLVKQIK